MATAAITFCSTGNRSIEGGSMPVPRLKHANSELVTVGDSSVASTVANPADAGTAGFVSVTAIGADLWVVAGATPVAVAGVAGFPVLGGQCRDFAVEAGDKIAVITL